jgi:large subunit ribosomal protein L4
MEAKIYNKEGKETGKITLSEFAFGAKWNNDLVYQVVMAMHANARTPVAHTKDRSEVSGTGKKPWKQKGTGNARHGSRRSPIWRTGGVAHGPRNEKSYKQKINKKMRVNAFYSTLSKKYKDGEVLFVESFEHKEPKTKDAKHAIESLSKIKGFENLLTKKKNAVLMAGNFDENTIKSFRNFNNFALEEVRNLNPAIMLKYKYLILVGGDDAVKQIESRSFKTKTENK